MPRWFALALCALGAILLVAGLRQSSRARQARGWTRTTAKILESRVEQGGDLLDPEQRRETFGFVIRYAYEAHGRPHESAQVWIGSSAASSDHPGAARQWVERFPAGAEVPVWFDPADPRQAVLIREIPGHQATIVAVVGAALAAAGLVALARAAGR